MVDWTKSMNQTFEYYIVDPNTWADVKKLDNVKACSIDSFPLNDLILYDPLH